MGKGFTGAEVSIGVPAGFKSAWEKTSILKLFKIIFSKLSIFPELLLSQISAF